MKKILLTITTVLLLLFAVPPDAAFKRAHELSLRAMMCPCGAMSRRFPP